MSASWFPVAKGMIEEESFRTLTATEKLYLFQVMSDFNLNDGEFYRADIEYAATLKLSLEKIRKARAKLKKLGYIDMIPGKQDLKRKKNIATIYKGVKWLEVPDGEQWSQISRPTFEALVDYIREERFTHEDVVCWIYIAHLCWCGGGQYAAMTKKEFLHITNMPSAIKCVNNLLKNFTYNGGAKLFTFSDGWRAVRFDSIQTAQFNQDRLDATRKNIATRVEVMRAIEKQKEKEKLRENGAIAAEELMPLFIELYKKKHGKNPTIGQSGHEVKLRELGDPRDVARAIDLFFSIEPPRGVVNLTISNFIKNAGNYMAR